MVRKRILLPESAGMTCVYIPTKQCSSTSQKSVSKVNCKY